MAARSAVGRLGAIVGCKHFKVAREALGQYDWLGGWVGGELGINLERRERGKRVGCEMAGGNSIQFLLLMGD